MSTASKVIEWLPEARIPSASQSSWISTPAAVGRDLRVAVALDAVVVGEGDRGVEHRRGRRHRAERLAPIDSPARGRARRGRRRARQVLAQLADGGGDDHPVAGDRLHRRGEDPRPAARRPRPPRSASAARCCSRMTRCMFTPIATEASPRARRLDATSTSWTEVTPEPAVLDGDRRCEVALALSASMLACGNEASRSCSAARVAKSSDSDSARAPGGRRPRSWR